MKNEEVFNNYFEWVMNLTKKYKIDVNLTDSNGNRPSETLFNSIS